VTRTGQPGSWGNTLALAFLATRQRDDYADLPPVRLNPWSGPRDGLIEDIAQAAVARDGWLVREAAERAAGSLVAATGVTAEEWLGARVGSVVRAVDQMMAPVQDTWTGGLWDHTEAWVLLMACAGLERDVAWLAGTPETLGRLARRADWQAQAFAVLGEWTSTVGADLGPWACAAGLTPAEARHLTSRDLHRLRGLAHLRGFRLPSTLHARDAGFSERTARAA
jgi:hypothetical protein